VGSLTLPASGRVYVDTQVIVYAVEKHPEFSATLRLLWQSVQAGALVAVSSELVVHEVLVLPLRNKDTALVDAYEGFVQQPGFELQPITRGVLRDAAVLRSRLQRLRTPDAIHAATAIAQQCQILLTNDRGLRGIDQLDVCVLSDVL